MDGRRVAQVGSRRAASPSADVWEGSDGSDKESSWRLSRLQEPCVRAPVLYWSGLYSIGVDRALLAGSMVYKGAYIHRRVWLWRGHILGPRLDKPT